MAIETYTLRATRNSWPIVDSRGIALDPGALPLSERLLIAIADWRDFFDEVDGVVSDPDIGDEFVSQGFKIAYALRRELKGRAIYLSQPVTGEQVEIG